MNESARTRPALSGIVAHLTTRLASVSQNQRRPPNNDNMAGAPFDSIFAQKGVANGGGQLHNEFVVFRGMQVFPEFLVWYTC